MATIIVPSDGATVSNVILNGALRAPAGTDLNGSTLFYEVDGTSTLQSLDIGYDIEVTIGYLASGTLTGTGSITGPTDPAGGNLPLIDNYGMLDINGKIGTPLSNDGQVKVSSGERLDLAGDLLSIFGTISVATSGELDLDSPNSALISQLTLQGKLMSATPNTTLQQTTNTGTIDITAGTLALASTMTGDGTIIVESGAKLDMSAAQAVSGTIVLEAGSTLKVSQTTAFSGTLQNPATSTIDLINLAASTATVSNGAILIATPSGSITLGETGLTQGAMLAITSDGSGGSLISLASNSTPNITASSPGASMPSSDPPVYRFFDSVHGTQFLTASDAEATSLQATRPDLVSEGVDFYSVNATQTNAAPVYRFFDTVYGTHFYTSSAAEEATVATTRPDLTYEGIGFYEQTTQQSGDVPVYRFFEQTNGTHFYTSSAVEKTQILATRPDLTLEGVGFYAPTS